MPPRLVGFSHRRSEVFNEKFLDAPPCKRCTLRPLSPSKLIQQKIQLIADAAEGRKPDAQKRLIYVVS